MNIKQAIDTISLKDLIESTGRQPASINTAKGEYIYSAPYREDNDPSLVISLTKKKFRDYGQEDAKGDVVQLARLIIGNGNASSVSVSEALQWLKKFGGGEVTPAPAKATQRFIKPAKEVSHDGQRYTLIKAAPITARSHPNNLDYIVGIRKIGLPIAARYLEAITYKDNAAPKTDILKGFRYGIGGQNDAGGYEVRAASSGSNFKTSLGQKDITTFNGDKDATSGDIFEGRFDFLTWLEICGKLKPTNPTIILNTGRFAARAADIIKTRQEWENIKTWRIWQHNDDEGDRTTQVICAELSNYQVGTLNHYWEGYNDLNEFWTNAPNEQRSELVKTFSGNQPATKFFDSSATSALRKKQEFKPS